MDPANPNQPARDTGRDTRDLFVLVGALVVVYHPLALWLMRDADAPPTPYYLYAVIAALYVAFVGIHWIGRKAIDDRTSALAALVSNSIPLTAVFGPFIVAHVADRVNGTSFVLASSAALGIGIGMTVVGVAVIILCEVTIKDKGQGTLSPMEEINTRALVVTGPYAHVRNPMIAAVVVIMLGLSLISGSNRFLLYVAYFVVVKTIWFKYSEEPSLRRRFGDAYEHYARHVRRWLPRPSAYRP